MNVLSITTRAKRVLQTLTPPVDMDLDRTLERSPCCSGGGFLGWLYSRTDEEREEA